MKTKILLSICAMAFGLDNANACKVFKDCHKGNPLKHLENAAHDIGDNAADVVTLGAKKREEERKEAAEAKRRAQIAKENAERQKQEAIASEREKIAAIKVNIVQNQSVEAALSVIESNLDANIKMTEALIEGAKGDKIKSAKVIEVVLGQQADLLKNLEGQKSSDAGYAALIKKIKMYAEQLSKFPVENATEEDLDNLYSDLIEQKVEILSHLKQVKAGLLRNTEALKISLLAAITRLDNLNGTPKKQGA